MPLKSIAATLGAAATALIGVSAPVFAQDTAAEFSLELNNAADTTTGGCRLTYVAANRTGTALATTSYEVAVFDGTGVVTRILVLEFGALTEGKTKVVQFDLADQPCANISRIVVNNISECTAADGTASDLCLANLVTGSRATIQFGL